MTGEYNTVAPERRTSSKRRPPAPMLRKTFVLQISLETMPYLACGIAPARSRQTISSIDRASRLTKTATPRDGFVPNPAVQVTLSVRSHTFIYGRHRRSLHPSLLLRFTSIPIPPIVDIAFALSRRTQLPRQTVKLHGDSGIDRQKTPECMSSERPGVKVLSGTIR
jgi:hypothetical protein